MTSIDSVALEVEDPAAAAFFVEHGPEVARSFGRKYVQFAGRDVTLALYGRRALAKDADVSPDGAGSHRIIICSDAGTFSDPDAWEAARDQGGAIEVATGSPAVPQAT